MSLPSWTWDSPDPVVADDTLIRASHLNDIRDAIDNTRLNTPTASTLLNHASSHIAGGSDPIVGSLLLNNYKYYGIEGALLSSEPTSNTTFLSNNIWKSSPTTWTKQNTIPSTVLRMDTEKIQFGYCSSGATSPTFNAYYKPSSGELYIPGDITASNNLNVTGNIVCQGTVTSSNIPDNITIEDLETNSLEVGSGGISCTGNLSANNIECNTISPTLVQSSGVQIYPYQGTLASYDKTLRVWSSKNTGENFVVIPELTIDSLSHNFRLMVANGNSFSTPVGTMEVDARNLRIGTLSSNLGSLISIGRGTTGGGYASSAPTYGGVDINDHLYIYDRDTSTSRITFRPNSKTVSSIGYNTNKQFMIYGNNEFSDGTLSLQRRVHVSDQLIVGTISQLDNTKLNHMSTPLWIPYSTSIGGRTTNGGIVLGNYNSQNLNIFSSGLQTRTTNNGRADLLLNPYYGDVSIGSGQSSLEANGLHLKLYGIHRVMNKHTNCQSIYAGSRHNSFLSSWGIVNYNYGCEIAEFFMDYNGGRATCEFTLIRDDRKTLDVKFIVGREGSSTHVYRTDNTGDTTELKAFAVVEGNTVKVRCFSDEERCFTVTGLQLCGGHIQSFEWAI